MLGLGVSHVPLVEGFRGQNYGKPIETMGNYLKNMKSAGYVAPEPAETPKTVIAALGPKMLALAALEADGAHPYNVTPAHTRQAREILGPANFYASSKWCWRKPTRTRRAKLPAKRLRYI